MRRLFSFLTAVIAASALMLAGGAALAQQSSEIAGEFIMTLHAPLYPPQVANADYFIYNVKPGGWVKGPNISGEVIGPSGDWGRVMPNGTFKLDVRASILADDGSIIFVTYTGRVKMSEDVNARLTAGETIGPEDMYFLTNPTFETTSEKYGWLNDIVAVGKCVAVNMGENSFVTYDIFAMK